MFYFLPFLLLDQLLRYICRKWKPEVKTDWCMCPHMLRKFGLWILQKKSWEQAEHTKPACTLHAKSWWTLTLLYRFVTYFLNTDLGFCSAKNIPLKVSKWCVTHSGTPPTFPWLEKGKGVLKITLRILSKWPEEKKEQGEGIIKMINESWVCCYYRLCCFFSREGMYHFLLEKL